MQVIGMLALLLLTPLPGSSQAVGNEWDTLNQEMISLYQKGEYDRAVIVAKKALEVARKNHGENHPAVATSLNYLASLYYSQALYAQAEPLYKRSLAIREKALGPNHPEVATSLNNLATLYHSQGLYTQAEPLFKRSLTITREGSRPGPS